MSEVFAAERFIQQDSRPRGTVHTPENMHDSFPEATFASDATSSSRISLSEREPASERCSDLNQFLKQDTLHISMSGHLVFVATTSAAAILQDEGTGNFSPALQDELNYEEKILASAIDRSGKYIAVAINDMVGLYEVKAEGGQVQFTTRASFLVPQYESAPTVAHLVFSSQADYLNIRYSDGSAAQLEVGENPRGVLSERKIETEFRLSA